MFRPCKQLFFITLEFFTSFFFKFSDLMTRDGYCLNMLRKKAVYLTDRTYTQKCLMLTKIFCVLYLVFVLHVFQPWKLRFIYFWIICLKWVVVFPCFGFVTMYCEISLLKTCSLFIYYEEFCFFWFIKKYNTFESGKTVFSINSI